jgi:hypothetical protein
MRMLSSVAAAFFLFSFSFSFSFLREVVKTVSSDGRVDPDRQDSYGQMPLS